MIKKIILISGLFIVCTMHGKSAQTDVLATPTWITTTTFVQTSTFDICGTHTLCTGTDFTHTGSLCGFGQAINDELCSFLNVLTADRHIFQEWNMKLSMLAGSFDVNAQQHTSAINQVRLAIGKLQQMLTDQINQGQNCQATVVAVTTQLQELQQQTDQEIIALQQQLDETTHELNVLEDEYGEFIDASFAQAQGFYNMLALAKQEYSKMIRERTQFFTSLQSLTNALQQSQGMTSEVTDLLQAFTSL